MLTHVNDGCVIFQVPAVVPKLTRTPGETTWAGPDLGAHTRAVLQDMLGMSDDAVARLEQDGVILCAS